MARLTFAIVLTAMLLLTPIIAYASRGSVELLLHYNNGEVTLSNIQLLERDAPNRFFQPFEAYTARIVAFNGSELYSRAFDFPLWEYDSTEILDEVDFQLIAPYFNYMREFELYGKQGELILTADLSEYAVCNQNRVCNKDYGETKETCADDCTYKEIMPTETEAPAEKAAVEKPSLKAEYIAIAALALVLAVIIMVILKQQKKRQQ